MWDYKKSGDFKKYYDTSLKRNIWVLGYFGGGAVNICEAYEIAKDYAKENNVPLETVQIDEILHSRRFKHFKYISSNTEQVKDIESNESKNVFHWLTD